MFDEMFAAQRVLGILRGFTPAETVARAERAWDLGLTAVEVTVEVPEQVPSLAAAVAAARERGLSVGAGTVYTDEQVRAAADAGAAFTVAPGYDPQIAAYSRDLGLPHLPGVASPSEIQSAVRGGHGWLKVFPASVLGPAWLRAVRGPFPRLRLVATGGIDAQNAAEFLDAGADAVAVGSALSDPEQLDRLAKLLGR
jgi:2-dehydro-3-deoxyphosphogluconate aldolase / (4S)-4-hydroxy-2-oxoglutarate aldolase